MKLPLILCSDLHLTARPSDEYRWAFFPWLAKELVAERAETLAILGDLVDQKDYHPAELVNRIVKEINQLRAFVPRIVILMGNHDFLKSGNMFFEFLNFLPGVEVITKPTEDMLDDQVAALWLPYTRTPAKDWRNWDFSHYGMVFLHQTIKGAIASNGQRMDGEPLVELNAGKVFSGDIHVPQKIGSVEYVGSPYHVHFGDSFKPRCIAIDRDHRQFDLHFPCISRTTVDVAGVEGLRAVDARPGDQIKVRVHLSEADKHQWRETRRAIIAYAADQQLALSAVELIVKRSRRRVGAVQTEQRKAVDFRDTLYNFVDRDALGGDLLDVGLEILES